MFCYQCGAQIEDGLAFCTNCGAKQVSEAAQQKPVEAAPAGEETVVIGVNHAQNNTQYNANYAQNNTQYNANYAQNNTRYNASYAQNNTQYTANNGQKTLASPMKATFGEAIKLYFANYTNFTGRSTVSEYWWAYLFNYLASLVLSVIPVLGPILSLALIIPGISLSVRRLHDTGKAWTYLFMGLIPIAGAIILIVRFCKESDADNQWGPAPKN